MNNYSLSRSFKISGQGIHTGAETTVTVFPGETGNGYTIKRLDLPDSNILKISPEIVTDTQRRTTLSDGSAIVHTAEHLLSALYGSNIYDAHIELSNSEIPILDGSSLPWIKAINTAGKIQAKNLMFGLKIEKKIRVEDESTGAWAEAIPSLTPKFHVELSHDENAIGCSTASFLFGDNYETEVAYARTFTLASHLTPLINRGLLKGANPGAGIIVIDEIMGDQDWKSLEDFVGIPLERRDDVGALPLTSYRSQNEPATHKLLDLIGDIALTGQPIMAEIRTFKPGHKINTLLAQKIMEEAVKNIPTYNPDSIPVMDVTKIMSIIPHRPPFLLVDKVVELSDMDIVGVKAITMNEPFFAGHFPGAPVMPGVLQLEAMAQVGGILALSTVDDPENYLTYFRKMDEVKFKAKVVPGDTLVFHLELTAPIRRGIVQMKGRAYVGKKLVSEGFFTAFITKEK
jgi:UDP-3-O-[3-hydroxymyristoyl] N-acetylglucosamine deacetylase/3-hydroxyacyl-[acyl-carrier-protein] dehydratase|tara:strand:+ start:23306 stop:24679 length:1374 start_codon:yes stop_codon:yes gene_type:complete